MKKVIFYLPMYEELFGLNGIIPYSSYESHIKGTFLSYFQFPFHVPFAILILLLVTLSLAVLYFLNIKRTIVGILIYLSLLTLRLRNDFILDGSDNVIDVILPFLIIAEMTLKVKNHFIVSITAYLKKLAILGLMIQVCYVYFFTAIAKLQGDLWLNGTAVYYTMRVNEFRVTPWNLSLTSNHYFVVLTTYFTILLELAFPFWIWFRQTKFIVISLCILFHFFIWVFMRIDDFSWMMIGSYSVFLSNNEICQIRYQVLKFFREIRLSYLPIK